MVSIEQIKPQAKISYIETAYGKKRGQVRTTTVKGLGGIVWINTGAGPLRLDEVISVEVQK